MFDGPAEGCSADRADGARPGDACPQYGFAGLERKETYVKWKLMAKAEWTANNASMFDASPFEYDKER